jgi:hypothetical protein
MTRRLLERASDRKARAWLAQSVSETASLAGWLAWDRADDVAADRYYRAAVKLADATGNPLLTAYQLGSLGAFMVDRDRNALAVLSLARQQLGPHPAAVADAWVSSLDAFARATLGDDHGTWHALDQAEAACQQIDDEEPPWPWVFTFDHTKIAAQRISCAARLGQPKHAVRVLSQVSAPESGHRRQGALFSFDLAEIYMQAGDLDEGWRLATAALEKATPYRSGRVVQRARSLRRRYGDRLSQADQRRFDDCLRKAT